VIKAKVDDVKSTQLTIGRGLELKMDGGRGRYLTDNHRPQGQAQQQQQQRQNSRVSWKNIFSSKNLNYLSNNATVI
jgi:hypothetical protein